MKFRTAKIAVAGALLAAFGMAGPLAQAQEAMMEEGGELEEVIVTGSYIKGSPEDAELPIDVVTDADLRQLGTPSAVELVRNLGVTAANLGETNQFTTDGQSNEGRATINLRGLGSARTLVLVNGRRHVSTELIGVDISAFPVPALGRIELLKDGAAAIYGSDAIAGVANFITRQDFDGFEIGGSYQDIEGSSGDTNIHFIWGTSRDNWNLMLTGEVGRRGELQIRDRDWALVNTDVNPVGGWSSIANPGRDIWIHNIGTRTIDAEVTLKDKTKQDMMLTVPGPVATVGHTFSDEKTCRALGAWRAGDGICGFNYAHFDNLIEKTETNKFFGSFDVDISDNHRLHVEALRSEVDIPEWKTSPSYPPQSFTGPDRSIPATHPGWQDYQAWLAGRFDPIDDVSGDNPHPGALSPKSVIDNLNNPNLSVSITALPDGASVTDLNHTDEEVAMWGGPPVARFAINRAMGVIGAFGTGAPEQARRYTSTTRFVIGADGSFLDGAMDYDFSLSWSKQERDIGGQDMYVERMALALNGFGGADCQYPSTMVNPNAGAPGQRPHVLTNGNAIDTVAGQGNCEYYNPYSRAIERSYVNGAENEAYESSVANSEDLLRWLIGEEHLWSRTNELLVLQGVISGETSWSLGGGNASYAVGAQARDESYDSRYLDLQNRALNPCPFRNEFSAALGLVAADQLTPDCSSRTGLKAFLAASDNFAADRTIFSLFGELALPLTSSLDMQLALRYEDYGGEVGASVDPKVALSWHVSDEFSLRASVSTTFRGPPQSILSGRITELAFVGPTGAFKAIDRDGNPNLEAENALSANLGVIYQTDSLYASLDYWQFTFEDSFQLESFNGILGAYGGMDLDCTTASNRADGSDCAQLAARIFPEVARDNLAATERIVVQWINGEEISTSGIDFKVRYDFKDVLPGTLGLALDGSYVLEYDIDDQLSASGIKLADGGDLVGGLNYNRGASFTSKPQLKLNFTASYETESHYASLVTRYVSAYDDDGAGLPISFAVFSAAYPELVEVDAHVTLDAHYQYTGWESFTVGLSAINLADEDPPAARGDLNYDPFTHNPFGRMIKLNFTYRM